ncbi:hypothetical protein CGRA01v4_09252 [Colletotrichum graminicola]|uniref:Uncharacterized protein n=1 Tax=Colletotrichum graminicola (strain M1.001 / M2 / FGSC 10212) TaxID=645133 RepID=E3Q6S3_COLGM|nr:uncharacterized protein GLRG_02381 [Colletotrichum graminicola M1.001]EFQ26561.1 hypothetical protein GLRG_02381 [Colletotrichum graminicola M1.001]WDK17967.1 hypothetical protein CGRA01v4_09252 [Colletotrichum graminicola]
MGRSGYDTTGLGGFVRRNPRPAGGSKAGEGGQKGGTNAVAGQERTAQTQQSHTAAAAGSASASAKNRGGGAAPPKK